MEENQKEQAVAKGKPGKKVWLIGAIVAVVVIALIIGGMAMGKSEPKIRCVKISTPHIDLLVPEELKDVITNDESTYGDVYTRGFYMSYGEMELPLWRVDFGDAYAGDWVGMLGDVPVTMTAFASSEEELAALGEEGYILYSDCMQAYSVMLEGIKSDSRFSPDRPLDVGEDATVTLTYWKLSLPNKMQVQEYTEGGNYEAVFSAEVVGEMVTMYRVCIGEKQATSLLGYYEVDGVKKPVSVETMPLVERESWTEDDYAAAYHMMDTINLLIDTIMSSKQFSTSAE